MDGGWDRPAGMRGTASAQGSPPGVAPLVGRRDVLSTFGEALDTSGGSCFFLGFVGEPGVGKTRLLAGLERFGRFFAGQLWDVYGPDRSRV
jgi:hypothetical protein